MTLSDFPRGVARASEGFCPLCDGELTRMPEEPPAGELVEHDLHAPGWCEECKTRWTVGTSTGALTLSSSRRLSDDERRRLYDRGEEMS